MINLRSLLFGLVLLALCVLLTLSATAADTSAPLRLLIFSGRNNHDWASTTPVLKKAFEGCKRFGVVDVTDAPEKLDPAAFGKYDVIVSNWTPYPQTKREWPEPLEKAFLDFVRNGGGFVVLHAACCTFQEWPEFQQIVGLTWKEKVSSHTAYTAFEVNIEDKDHPVTRGMPNFYIVDELYQSLVTLTDVKSKVLCNAFSSKEKHGTDKVEPVLVCTQFGKGCGATFILGHDAPVMRNVAFQTVVLRSAEWAATGEVTIPIPAEWPANAVAAGVSGLDPDEALKAMASYTFGNSRAPLAVVEELVRAALSVQGQNNATRERLASKLAGALTPEFSIEARQFLCRQLSIIGSEAQVPALAPLLTDEQLSSSARYALERIQGPAAGAALRDALGKTSGTIRVGIINSLGVRRDAESAPLLAGLLSDPDGETVCATAAALGKIGGPDASKALGARLAKAEGALRQAVVDAYVQCADTFMNEGNGQAACEIYKGLTAASESAPTRRAALRGLVLATKEGGVPLIVEALKDPVIEGMAITLIREVPGAGVVPAVAGQLGSLSNPIQAQVLAAFGDRGDTAALPAALALASSEDESVRVAALNALAKLGDASVVRPLLEHAGAGDAEREAAYNGLAVLRGQGVNEALVAALNGASPALKQGIIKTLAARNAVEAVDALMKISANADAGVRTESWKAIQLLGRDQDLPSLVNLLTQTRPEERDSAEKAVVAVARKLDEGTNRAEVVLTMLNAAHTPEIGCSLLRVLGGIGDDNGLGKLREAARDNDTGARDAAIRALCAWPTVAAFNDLLELARTQQDEVLRVLALQGFIRLAGQVKDKTPEQMTELLAQALKLATRPEERRAALGELGKHPCPAAMDLAVASLKDPGVANEAAVAAVQIASAITGPDQDRIKAGLRALMKTVENPEVKAKAFGVLMKVENPANLAAGAVASSPDTIDPDGGSGPDQAAIDNNPDTYWDEQDNQPLYVLTLTFKQAVDVSVVDILGHPYEQYRAKNFDIVCDGKVVKEVRDAHYDNNELFVIIPRTRCTSLEIRIPGGNGLVSPAIHELRVFNPDLG